MSPSGVRRPAVVGLVAAALLVAGLVALPLHRTRRRRVAAGTPVQVNGLSLQALAPTTAPTTTSSTAVTTTVPAPPSRRAALAASTSRPPPARVVRPPAPLTLPTPIPEPNRSGPRQSAAAGGGSAAGAVWPGDFPDPDVIRVGSVYYAFSTESGLQQVPVLRSVDLHTWQPQGDALPRLPSWSSGGFVWGPAVLQRNGVFLLFYSTQVAAYGRECISEAVSPLPQGPYADLSGGPLVCQLDRGGSIDPDAFVAADGSVWLVWKSNGTLNGEPTRIWSQPMTSDGRALTGQPAELLHTELPWEQPIIEGPAMWQTPDGQIELLYSANNWYSASYAIGAAKCATPAGPCTRVSNSPILATSGSRAGPGGPSLFADVTGQTYLAFHAWTAPYIGYPQGARRLYLARLTFVNGVPSVTP